MKSFLPLAAAAVLGVVVLTGAPPAPKPVYFYLGTTIDDHINTDITQDRLRRILPLLERYRRENPQVSATLLFSGAMSEELRNHNADNHLLDRIKAAIASGAIEAGYDGSGEPSYKSHPLVNLRPNGSPEENWGERVTSAGKVLTAARDPLTGEVRSKESGGLIRMQETLGPASFIRGVYLAMPNLFGPMVDAGIDSEIVHVLRRYNGDAVMQGLADSDTAHLPSPDYRGWVDAFSTMLSPDEDTSPELYWADGVLRSSEDGKRDLRLFRAGSGVDALKKVLAGLDRSRIRIVHIEIGSQRDYAKSMPGHVRPDTPLNYAYQHLDHPRYPDELRYSRAEIDAAFANQDAVLRYLTAEFIPANPGSRFVATKDLKTMTPPGSGYDIPMTTLRPAIRQMAQAWRESSELPKYLRIGNYYLSDADLFAVMAGALADRNRSGRLPDSVRVPFVFGPLRTSQPEHPAGGVVTSAAVAAVCARFADNLRGGTWTPVPLNAVPSEIAVAGQLLTPAQFLRLMAEALSTDAADAKLTIRPTDMFWGRDANYYRRRSLDEDGAAWTFKPAAIIPR